MSSKGGSSRTLEPVSSDRGFYFYSEIGRPLGLVANSLREFGALIKTVDIASLEFHLGREDFEKWITMLGDEGLTNNLARIRKSGLKGEKLRSEIAMAVQTRVKQLQRKPRKK